MRGSCAVGGGGGGGGGGGAMHPARDRRSRRSGAASRARRRRASDPPLSSASKVTKSASSSAPTTDADDPDRDAQRATRGRRALGPCQRGEARGRPSAARAAASRRGCAGSAAAMAAPPARGAVDALEAERQAGVLQLEQRIVDDRVLRAFQLLEEPDAADALAEEAAEHAVLGPHMPVLGRDVLDDVVGGGAEHVFGGVRLLLRRCRRSGSPARRT